MLKNGQKNVLQVYCYITNRQALAMLGLTGIKLISKKNLKKKITTLDLKLSCA